MCETQIQQRMMYMVPVCAEWRLTFKSSYDEDIQRIYDRKDQDRHRDRRSRLQIIARHAGQFFIYENINKTDGCERQKKTQNHRTGVTHENLCVALGRKIII